MNCRLPSGRFCALCCYNTEMPLTEDDMRRLEALGYRREEFAVKGPDGVWRLRNVDGHCFFLDPRTGACKVYPYRPQGCRLYPLVYDPDSDAVIVDPECPMAHTVDPEEAARLAPYVKKLVEAIYGRRARG